MQIYLNRLICYAQKKRENMHVKIREKEVMYYGSSV